MSICCVLIPPGPRTGRARVLPPRLPRPGVPARVAAATRRLADPPGARERPPTPSAARRSRRAPTGRAARARRRTRAVPRRARGGTRPGGRGSRRTRCAGGPGGAAAAPRRRAATGGGRPPPCGGGRRRSPSRACSGVPWCKTRAECLPIPKYGIVHKRLGQARQRR